MTSNPFNHNDYWWSHCKYIHVPWTSSEKVRQQSKGIPHSPTLQMEKRRSLYYIYITNKQYCTQSYFCWGWGGVGCGFCLPLGTLRSNIHMYTQSIIYLSKVFSQCSYHIGCLCPEHVHGDAGFATAAEDKVLNQFQHCWLRILLVVVNPVAGYRLGGWVCIIDIISEHNQ